MNDITRRAPLTDYDRRKARIESVFRALSIALFSGCAVLCAFGLIGMVKYAQCNGLNFVYAGEQ